MFLFKCKINVYSILIMMINNLVLRVLKLLFEISAQSFLLLSYVSNTIMDFS